MTDEKPCDCSDEHHKRDRSGHKHVGEECVHPDGKRHKVHKK